MGPNLCLFAPPKHLELPHPEIKVESIMMSLDGIVEITLSTDKMAFYVFLSCQVEGQFEENAFMMEMNERKVSEDEEFIIGSKSMMEFD